MKMNLGGGLGLYLLRKYIHELHGECTIVTGNCFLRLDETCFNSINVNQIFFVEYKKLMQSVVSESQKK